MDLETFGFSPKISTTVENAVEKRGVLVSSSAKNAILLVFLRGESLPDAVDRPSAAIAKL